MKFKSIKKIFKKFKILLNLQYKNLEIYNKTAIKSILSQSGILEAATAESHLETLFDILFYDIFNVLGLLKDKHIFKKKETRAHTKIFESVIWLNLLNFSFNIKQNNDNILVKKYTSLINLNAVRRGKRIKKKSVKNIFISGNSEDNVENADNNEEFSEFKKISFILPLSIYIYKKELKNSFLISNLFSSLLLQKLFFKMWIVKRKHLIRNFFYFLIIQKIQQWYGLFRKRYFLKKFSFSVMFIFQLFKFSLLKNFQFLYFNYFNYFNLYKTFSALYGNFFSFYNYHEFKNRKVNFRRKIRHNMLIENQYI